MKWLILFALIACGHEQPPVKDVADSDGDQVLNYLEEGDELRKYTAEVKPFGEIKARLSFRNELSLVHVDLSNESHLSSASFRLLTIRADNLRPEEHFSEWSKMRIMGPSPAVEVTDKVYEFTLRFVETSDKADSIELSGVSLGTYRPVMKFHLSGNEVRDLLNGKIHLTLKRKQKTAFPTDFTVRQRTYRVFWNDGHVAHVYYVSKELPFTKFITLKKIIQARNADELNGLGWADEEKDWWYRDLGESDKVLVKASERDIATAREKNFDREKIILQRINGQSSKPIAMTKSAGARVILKIRGDKEIRGFRETVRKSTRSGGHEEGPMNCFHYERTIVSEKTSPLKSLDILKNLHVAADNKIFSLAEMKSMARESSDLQGPYLEIHLDVPSENIRVVLPGRAVSTFTRTGVYQWYCEAIPMKYGGEVTNDEGHFTLKMDTFIEKLEESL